MKLPSMLEQFLPKQKPQKEVFASLILEQGYGAAALWEMGDSAVPRVLATHSALCEADTWEARLNAVDEALASVEDAAGTTKYTKAVLGLPIVYLTQTGEIKKEIRPEIKTLTRELELSPIGFVSIPQAVIYKLKKEEGVPPSVILMDVSAGTVSISLYKVGVLTGEHSVARTGDIAIQLEEVLKEFKNLEVLPARILLFGQDGKALEDVKTELLRYAWTTRVNFLHFPKMEIILPAAIADAVSLAGASELAHEVGQESEEPVMAAAAVADLPSEQNELKEEIATEPEAPVEEETLESQAEAEEEAEEIEEGEEIAEEESNVVSVDPQTLGFQKNVDVLENVEEPRTAVEAPAKKRIALPAFSIPRMPRVDLSGIGRRLRTGGKGPIVVIAGGLLLLIALLFWFVPHATVTVLELPKAIVESESITIDPTATSVDSENKVIPGAAQEKSVSGQKTIPVTGKKNVGDPAKGTVTIYNKMTEAKTFAKGTVLSVASLEFVLDDAVTVDAATVTGSLGSETKTFGQKNANITASAIGTESNLAANKTFSVKGHSSDEAIAINAQALTGGTSKQVTVVSRADYDAFLKAVSEDLVGKAKEELSAGVGGNEKLIDETITTSVTQKTFNQELDQEATELSGNATVTVAGTSYNDDDVKTILKAFITKDIPPGYTLAESRTQVTLENVKVLKDGKITAKATIKTDAVPTLNAAEIQNHLAGKTIAATQEYLRGLTGVAGVEVRFGLSFSHNRLPLNAKNITVSLAIQ